MLLLWSVVTFGGTYFAAEALAKAQADDLALESRLADRLAKEDVPWDIEMADGEIVSALSGAATLADLAIVSLPKAKGDFRSGPPMLAGDLALTASVPVLALPQDSKALDFDKPALIAWNGSPEAAMHQISREFFRQVDLRVVGTVASGRRR